jgi:hypothetical protein
MKSPRGSNCRATIHDGLGGNGGRLATECSHLRFTTAGIGGRCVPSEAIGGSLPHEWPLVRWRRGPLGTGRSTASALFGLAQKRATEAAHVGAFLYVRPLFV